MNLDLIAKTLAHARRERKLLKPFTDENPNFSLEEGYRVQHILREEAEKSGEVVVGYKMGLTSRAKQIDVGVYQAIQGFLTESMSLTKGGAVPFEKFGQPRFEPEVAVILSETVEGPQTLSTIRSLVSFIGPAVEILDSRYEGYRFKLPDVVADNTSAAGFVLGSSNWLNQIEESRLFGVRVVKNGECVATGAPAATFGDPLLSVVELLKILDRPLEAGQVILTGGLTAAPYLQRNDFIEVVWPGETISFQCT